MAATAWLCRPKRDDPRIDPVNSLPDLIEIVPSPRLIQARVTVPGSKSITNRALVLAALRDGETTLRGALWSEDTQVMTECLHALGFEVWLEPDPDEACNRSIRVRGLEGHIPRVGTAEQPLELFVGNAGTAARFLAAMVCLGQGVFRLRGVPRMHERPQSALFDALRQLGYTIESPNGRLPATIHGAGPRPGRCTVSVAESSQFASALLLCASTGGWEVDVTGSNADELPYVEMTRQLLRAFPEHGGGFMVEPDASSGSYFVAADFLARLGQETAGPVDRVESRIAVNHWPASDWQIDAAFPRFLPLPREVSRERDLGDSIMTGIVLAPFAPHPVRFSDLGRLRVQECERVRALRTELTRCGGRVEETGDTLIVHPAALRGAEVETYDDHRVAMCFAILGLKVPGVKIKNPGCVRKTFPNFFQKLATAAPRGLGLKIVDPGRGQELGMGDLFAG